MSYANFKPVIWNEIIDRELKKLLVFGMLANRDYEGEIKEEGDSVKIPSIASVKVGDYTGADIEFSEDEGTSQIITIDKAKYFALSMDDVDKAQAKNGVLDLRVQNAIYQLADAIDTELAKLYKKAKTKITAKIGTDNIAHKIIDLAAKMDTDKVPSHGRWLVLSPTAYGELVKALPTISKGEQTFKVNSTFYVGQWGGFEIYKSNNVQTTGNKYHCMAGISAGLTLAMQLDKMEAGRFEKSFKEFVKGLNLFGCDVLENQTGNKTTLIAEFEVEEAGA